MDILETKQWINDAMHHSTPVARRWAAERMRKGEKLQEFYAEFEEIIAVENKLYATMKKNLGERIRRHGLNEQGLKLFAEFEAMDGNFNAHNYEKLLHKIRRCYVQSGSDSLEYLIFKINEYLRKVKDIGDQAYQMLLSGKSPDLDSWSDKVALNDSLFEENKQFLKQSLHHLQTLRDNRCRLGVAEIRLLLYHRDGCRRDKLYREVEAWIVDIYNNLDTEDERREIYPEICRFVADMVPQVGYISPFMMNFVFDRGFLSSMSRDLLVAIYPVITRLDMTPLVLTPLLRFYSDTLAHLQEGTLTETDEYVMQIMQAYQPKAISTTIMARWQELKAQ